MAAMNDVLQNILEIAERDMGEGDYVRFADILRDFHRGTARTDRDTRRFVIARPIKISFRRSGTKHTIELIHQERLELLQADGRYPTLYRTEYKYNDSSVQFSTNPFSQLVKYYLHLHSPQVVHIDSFMGHKMLSYKTAQKRAMEFYKVITKRIADAGDDMPDQIRDHLNEIRQNHIDFTYTDFVNRVNSGIPDIEDPSAI